jgi:hypothetical protein
MYQLQKPSWLNGQQFVKRIADGACIPFAEDNTDYQQYLKWLEEGNTPLPADEQGETP